MPRLSLTARTWLRRICWIVPLTALIAGLAVFIWQYAWGAIPGLAAETIAPLNVTLPALPPESHLRIAVAPPLDQRYAGHSGPLELEIENDGDDAGVLTASGAADGGCIRLESAQVTAGDNIAATADAVRAHVPAHSAIPIDIPIDTTCASVHLPHSEPMVLAYNWSIPAPKQKAPAPQQNAVGQPNKNRNKALYQTFAGFISTSPLTVTSHKAEFFRHGAAICDQLAKDFTWPVLLTVLGFLAQMKLAIRGDRQQILNTLLPSYTELVQTHYLPIARRMQIIGIEADLIAPSPAPPNQNRIAVERTFCAILLMRRRMQYLFSTKGGIFFRSAVAEDLFFTCVSNFYARIQEATGSRSATETLAVSLDPGCTLEEAIVLIFSPVNLPAANPLLAGFSAWAIDSSGQKTVDFDGYLAMNQLAMAVLNFESNRIYFQTDQTGVRPGSSWYFDPPQLAFVPAMTEIHAAERAEVTNLFTQYLDGIPKQCRKNVAYPT